MAKRSKVKNKAKSAIKSNKVVEPTKDITQSEIIEPAKRSKKFKSVGSGSFAKVRGILYRDYSKRLGLNTWGDEKVVANEVLGVLRERGLSSSIKNIKGVIKELHPRVPKYKPQDHPPEIPPSLLMPYHFFDSVSFMKSLEDLTPDLWVVSKMIWGRDSKGKEIGYQCGTKLVYEDTFQALTNYLSSVDRDMEAMGDMSGSQSKLCIKLVLPISWHPARKRWQVEIILCDGHGNRMDYGYVPNKDNVVKEEVVKAIVSLPAPVGVEVAEPVVPSASVVTSSESEAVLLARENVKIVEAQEKTRQLREQRFIDAMRLLESGKMSEATFNKLMEL